MTIRFKVDGLPKAQPRVKAYKRGKHAGVYTPDTADDWKALVMLAAKENRPKKIIKGPISLDVTFIFPRPKSHFRTGKNINLLKDSAPFYHTCKPDRDNLDKCVMDAITAIQCVWGDDCQVCAGRIAKRFKASPIESAGAIITLKELGEEEMYYKDQAKANYE